MATKIIVTGANGQIGRALLGRLWDTSAETYAVTRAAGSLRASKVFTSPLDSERVQKAIHQSDVVVHLAGSLWPKTSNTYYGANVATTAALIKAARDSNVKRIIFLSSVDAREDSSNEYLKTKGQAETLLRLTGIPTVVFRCTHIIGGPDLPGTTARALQSTDGEPVKVLGSGQQIVAPVFVNDVVSAILMAIDKGRSGTYELSGPDRMTMDDLVRMVNQIPDISIKHLPGRLSKFLSKVIPGMPSALIDLMLKPSVGNSAQAVAEFGIRLTSLPTVWNVRREPSKEAAMSAGEEIELRT